MPETCRSANPPDVPNNSSSTGIVYNLYPPGLVDRISVPSMSHKSILIFQPQKAQTTQKAQDLYSTTARTSPAFTVSPGLTLIETTTPSRGDFISFCIFIASTTTTPAPFSTLAPASVCTRTTLPGIGARISAAP